MKKSILNLGKTLNKKEQKKINGGNNTINACNCDYRTGRWSHNNCGNGDCREIQVDDELPCRLTLINGLAFCI